MKFLKIIIAFAVLYVFFGVIAFLIIGGSWISTYWANSYDRPIATVYITKDSSGQKRLVQVVTLKNGSALTALVTRDVEQNGGSAQIIDIESRENKTIFVRFAVISLQQWLYPVGYTSMYKLNQIAQPDGSIPYSRDDQMLSTIELNQTLFSQLISGISIETIEVPISELDSIYDIMLSADGLSLVKRE